MPYSLTFIRIYFSGMIANLVYNIGAGILRAIGDSRRPLYYLMASICLNISLDLLFVGVFHWDVAGVAVATVISQIFSASMVCLQLMRTKESYHLSLRLIRFHKEMLIKIIRIGLPAGLQSLMYTSTNVIIQSTMNSFGTITIAAWAAYSKIDGIFWMTMNSFGISITTFVGQNFGARRYERIRKGVRICLVMAMLAAVGLSTFLYHMGPYIYRLFTKDPLVLEKGVQIVHFFVPTFITYSMIEIFSGALRGLGNSLIPMIMTCVGICVLRLVWIFTMVPRIHDVKTVILSYPITWTVTSILFLFYYRYYTKKQSYFNVTQELN